MVLAVVCCYSFVGAVGCSLLAMCCYVSLFVVCTWLFDGRGLLFVCCCWLSVGCGLSSCVVRCSLLVVGMCCLCVV